MTGVALAETVPASPTGPGSYPLTIYRGDSYAWQFVLWEDTAGTIPVDLTDATAAAYVGAWPLACQVTLPNTIHVALDHDTSASLTSASSRWDLQLTWADGRVQTVVAGPVTVTPDVTP